MPDEPLDVLLLGCRSVPFNMEVAWGFPIPARTLSGTGAIIVYRPGGLGDHHEGGVAVPVSRGDRHQVVFLEHYAGISIAVPVRVRMDDVLGRKQAVHSPFQGPVAIFRRVCVKKRPPIILQVEIPFVEMDLPFRPVIIDNECPVNNHVVRRNDLVRLGF